MPPRPSTDSGGPHPNHPETAYNDDTNIARYRSDGVELETFGTVRLRRNSGALAGGCCVWEYEPQDSEPVRSLYYGSVSTRHP
jgi:hypothetical protein